MKQDPEHDELIKQNRWLINLDETIEVIKRLAKDRSDWSWVKNTQCKYIQLRIDMRDGGFVLLNRNGNRISLKQLQWQYDLDKEPKP